MKSLQRFEKAVQVILRHEGGFAYHPSDPGGETNFGVTARFLKGIKLDVNNDGEINALDIKALAVNDAIQIYYNYWWKKYQYDKIDNLRVGTFVFDLAVNIGSLQAHKLLQEAANSSIILKEPLKVDGYIGPRTLMVLNDIDFMGLSYLLMDNIKTNAKQFYIRLAESNKSLGKFLKGWLNRIADDELQKEWST